jgi:guanyl-specific ribonuclease Sa
MPGGGVDLWGLSRYAYVEGNPVDRADPTGHVNVMETGGSPAAIEGAFSGTYGWGGAPVRSHRARTSLPSAPHVASSLPPDPPVVPKAPDTKPNGILGWLGQTSFDLGTVGNNLCDSLDICWAARHPMGALAAVAVAGLVAGCVLGGCEALAAGASAAASTAMVLAITNQSTIVSVGNGVLSGLSGDPSPASAAPAAGPAIARIAPGSLVPAEEKSVLATLSHIDAGTQPTGAVSKKWGTQFKNYDGDLPGPSGAGSPYLEYRVAPPVGTAGAGTQRIIQNPGTGEMYYTWTHYGDTGIPAFVQIR